MILPDKRFQVGEKEERVEALGKGETKPGGKWDS